MDEASKQKRIKFLEELDELCERYQFRIELKLNYAATKIEPMYRIVDVPPPEKTAAEVVAEVEPPVEPKPEEVETPNQDKPVGEVPAQP